MWHASEDKCFWVGKHETDHLGDVNLYGRIILKCIFKKSVGRVWTGLIGLRTGPSSGLL
jgi:hypothetical protein